MLSSGAEIYLGGTENSPSETGLYYLSSRYYDPEVGRFINADDIAYLDPESINGLNLYAYCLNNPIMMTDSTGCKPTWSAFWRGLGRVITGVLAVVAGAMVIVSGVAGIGMLIVAGITIAAGALTTINGAADIEQGFSGYDFMRDGVFGGNQTAYIWYSGITEGIAIVGSMVCGGWLKYNQSIIQVYKNMSNYNVKGNHLPEARGDWAKFSSAYQSTSRITRERNYKKHINEQLVVNSPDSFKLLYNAGRMVGVGGEMCVKTCVYKLRKDYYFLSVLGDIMINIELFDDFVFFKKDLESDSLEVLLSIDCHMKITIDKKTFYEDWICPIELYYHYNIWEKSSRINIFGDFTYITMDNVENPILAFQLIGDNIWKIDSCFKKYNEERNLTTEEVMDFFDQYKRLLLKHIQI